MCVCVLSLCVCVLSLCVCVCVRACVRACARARARALRIVSMDKIFLFTNTLIIVYCYFDPNRFKFKPTAKLYREAERLSG